MSDPLQLAAHHLDGGRPEAALAALAPYVAANPGDPDALCLHALALSMTGRHDDAVAAARSAAALDPDDEHVLTTLSRVLRESGRVKEAVAAARQARAIAPESAETHIQVAESLLERPRRRSTREAVAAAREAVRLDPHDVRSHDVLGRALLLSKRLPFSKRRDREAEEAFRGALRLRPSEPVLLNNLGVALIRQRRREEAFASFAAAARLDPSFDLPRTNTEGRIRWALWAAVVVPAYWGIQLAGVAAAEGDHAAAAAIVAVVAGASFLALRRMLPEPARRYLRAYARLHAPTRGRVRAIAVGAAACAALVLASLAFPARDRLATSLAVQAALVAGVVAWASTWRRVRPPATVPVWPPPAALGPRFAAAVVEGVGVLVAAVLLSSPIGGRADTKTHAWWVILPVVFGYLGYCDGVLGASMLRRNRLVVVDAVTGRRIGFLRALARAVVKVALWPSLVLALLSRRRRAPHDLLFRTAAVQPRR